MNTIVAPNIKEIIRNRCLKQSAVAEKAGYTAQQFSAMLNGRKVIRDIDISRIASVLNVDANELFKKEGMRIETERINSADGVENNRGGCRKEDF